MCGLTAIIFCVLQTDLAGIARWLISSPPSSVPKTLIFTQTKNIACKIYAWLSEHAATKTRVSMYHASLTHSTKAQIQQHFSSSEGDLRCLVSTVAFGMVNTVLLVDECMCTCIHAFRAWMCEIYN